MYGSFSYACRQIPSLAVCNLFFRQLIDTQPTSSYPQLLNLPDPAVDPTGFTQSIASFGVGVRPVCALPRFSSLSGDGQGYTGNVADVVVCALCFLVALFLVISARRRPAAVARIEMTAVFVIYALTLPFQLLDTGSILEQGSTALTWITAIHLALVVVLFWALGWTAFLSFQFVEDGTMASFVPFTAGLLILFFGSAYIGLDTGLSVTSFFKSTNPGDLQSAWLFSLIIVWPLVAAVFWYVVSVSVVVKILREKKPLLLFTLTAFLFALSQGARWALSQRICQGTQSRVDGSFLATLLETATAVALFYSWRSITEDSWDSYSLNSSGFVV